jgi:hypothetical protein
MRARKLTQFAVSLFVTIFVSTVAAEQPQENSQLCLALDLFDGSHIRGIPRIKSVPVKTSYAKMDIPLEEIASIKIENGHETASFELRNGDKLTGALNLESIELKTVFGEVLFKVPHVRTVYVYPTAKIDQGLVLYYSFDKDEGARVTDLSGRGNHGEIHGAKWTNKGKAGGAYEFDGQAHIALANKRFLDGCTDTTLNAWFNSHLPPGQGGQIIASGDERGGKDPITTRINTAGFEDFGLTDTNKGVRITTRYGHGVDVNPGSWQMLTITLGSGPTNSSYTVYLDGNVIDSQEYPDHFSISYDRDMPTQIGAVHGTQGWVGLIDEVMIFNRALSESEIKQLYLSQK